MFIFTFYLKLFEVHFTGLSPQIITNTLQNDAIKQCIHINMYKHACRRRTVSLPH